MLITFVIPSIGRATLANTLCSLYEQSYDDWNAIVCFDDVKPIIKDHYKVHVLNTPSKLGVGRNGAGAVRNYAIKEMAHRQSLGKWIGFVDDDDTLSPMYTDYLFHHNRRDPVPDIIVFSMQWVEGRVLPRDHTLPLEQLENDIGISFCCQKHVFSQIQFDPSSGEDFDFLKRAQQIGFMVKIVPEVMYYVNPIAHT